MNAFDKAKGELPVNGRVVDLAGNIITSPIYPMEVSLNTPYGAGCQRTVQVPVTDGLFEAKIPTMFDKRSFKTKVKLVSGADYLKIEQALEFVNFIDTTELFL